MSDGNFNRALLPSSPYSSGVKMGRQQAKTKAMQALSETLDAVSPSLNDAEKAEIKRQFASRLQALL